MTLDVSGCNEVDPKGDTGDNISAIFHYDMSEKYMRFGAFESDSSYSGDTLLIQLLWIA